MFAQYLRIEFDIFFFYLVPRMIYHLGQSTQRLGIFPFHLDALCVQSINIYRYEKLATFSPPAHGRPRGGSVFRARAAVIRLLNYKYNIIVIRNGRIGIFFLPSPR